MNKAYSQFLGGAFLQSTPLMTKLKTQSLLFLLKEVFFPEINATL